MEAKQVRDWIDKSGLRCVVLYRSFKKGQLAGGWYCGYVRVQPPHPWAGLEYDSKPLEDINVHGGLTYSGETPTGVGVQGDYTGTWFGFDCAHGCDDRAGWDDESVIAETEKLAAQIARVQS